MTTLQDNALTTVATLEGVLGISSGSEDDRLNRLINVASDRLEKELGRKLARKQVTEKVAGYGTLTLRVSRTPLLSVSSITFDDEAVSSNDYEIWDAEAGEIRSDCGAWANTARISGVLAPTPIAGTQQKLFEVSYTGGYVTPQQASDTGDTRTLPSDIEQAVIQYAVMLYHGESRPGDIAKESIDGASTTYRDDQRPAIWRDLVADESPGVMIG